MHSTLNRAFETVLQISWQASVLVILILLAQRIFRNRLSPRWRCAMWGLLLIRLAIPVLPESRWSAWGFLQNDTATSPLDHRAVSLAPTVAPASATEQVPSIDPASSEFLEIAPPLQWMDFAFWAWLAGTAAIAARVVVLYRRFDSKVRLHGQPAPRDICLLIADCCREIRLKPNPQAVYLSAASIPSVFGIFRPVLLLPPGIEQKLDSKQLRFVILHELMHIRRRDVLIGTILGVFSAIHWFNPLLWLASRRFKLDRELACDAALLMNVSASARKEYGNTILKVLECFSPSPEPITAVTMAGSRSSVHTRLVAITHPVRGSWMFASAAMLVIGAIGCATFTSPPLKTAASPSIVKQAFSSQQTVLVTRSYTVADLQRAIQEKRQNPPPQWNAISASAERPASTAPEAPPSGLTARIETSNPPVVEADQVIPALMNLVEPHSWQNRGGRGTAEMRDGEIVIQQSPSIQEKIQGMVQFVGRQILVETRFVTYDKQWLDWERSHKEGWATYGELMLWSRPLQDADVSDILNELNKSQGSTILTAPRLTLFNGQIANVVVATETAYVKDLVPGLGKDSVEFDPVIGVVTSGVSLECTANISLDANSVILNLKPKLQRLKGLVPHSVNATWQEGKIAQAFVQVPVVESVEFDRTFRAPNNRTLLIKMNSVVGEIERNGRLQQQKQYLYLLVRATIITPENQP